MRTLRAEHLIETNGSSVPDIEQIVRDPETPEFIFFEKDIELPDLYELDQVSALQHALMSLSTEERKEVVAGLPREYQNEILVALGMVLLSRKDSVGIGVIIDLADQAKVIADSMLGDNHPLIRALKTQKADPIASERMMRAIEQYRQRIDSDEVSLDDEACQ
jgi:hypothetical protein